ncbi:uncharacterized protein F5147DRAFT_683654 [Suillus discolor]|uniref:Secreted protein n=1 Tax=Suillus discolor TaxID=1912936 RepID=A0A9P7JWI8_9AGAM|nr:uncharacterized protein F5147DRAFT_683654 [Suillus discolor]KAG2112593.1 hypothetical protein F5147DRAFT_683654 [Suillus discolor]
MRRSSYALARAHLCVLLRLQAVSPFISKHPSRVPRVLEVAACPPYNLCHLIELYPLYYDPLYYPQYHPSVFATSENFCIWLRASLSTHCDFLFSLMVFRCLSALIMFT